MAKIAILIGLVALVALVVLVRMSMRAEDQRRVAESRKRRGRR
jgi:uncharacterized membrane protein